MKARLTQCLVYQLIAIEFSEFRKLLNDLSKSFDNSDHRDFIASKH